MDRPDSSDVVAAAAGDLGAFERLVRATQGPLWRYLVHLVGDRHLAEDLTQEVYIRVHRRLGSLRDPDRFVPWLLVSARNAAYDAGRSKKRRPLDLVGDQQLPVPANVGDPHVGMEIREAVASLEPDLREALILVGVFGLTYVEAGEVTGVPDGTVKSRVFRARRRLADELGGLDG